MNRSLFITFNSVLLQNRPAFLSPGQILEGSRGGGAGLGSFRPQPSWRQLKKIFFFWQTCLEFDLGAEGE